MKKTIAEEAEAWLASVNDWSDIDDQRRRVSLLNFAACIAGGPGRVVAAARWVVRCHVAGWR